MGFYDFHVILFFLFVIIYEKSVMVYKVPQSIGKIEIRSFRKSDIFGIVSCFSAHQNPKSQAIFDVYFSEQEAGDRLVWVAYCDNQFAGYCTLKWQSDYESFRE